MRTFVLAALFAFVFVQHATAVEIGSSVSLASGQIHSLDHPSVKPANALGPVAARPEAGRHVAATRLDTPSAGMPPAGLPPQTVGASGLERVADAILFADGTGPAAKGADTVCNFSRAPPRI